MRSFVSSFVAVATLALVASNAFAVPAVAAGPRPLFQLPFHCGEQWEAVTRPDHDPIEKIDFFKVGGGTNGSPIVASYGGRVIAAGWATGPGYFVTIDHGGGWKTQYFHMIRTPSVAVGVTVAARQELGYVGSTGDSSAPHLHYEQRRDNVIVPSFFDGIPTSSVPGRSQRLISKNCYALSPSAESGRSGLVSASPGGANPAPADGPKRSVAGDRDGDGKTDLVTFRPSQGTWYIVPSGGGAEQVHPFGHYTDKLVPGDYDGDRKMDLAVFRPSEGKWYIQPSRGTNTRIITFGRASDTPVPGDYDGDGRTDLAIFSPREGTWYVAPSSGGGVMQAYPYGYKTDKVVPGDYDGDGKTDLAVFRPSETNWYIAPSGGGPQQVVGYGYPDGHLVPADYDGDGKTDLAVFRPGEGKWYIRPSDGSGERTYTYGSHIDKPVPGDYDGDGKTDLAFVRPREGKLFILPSSGGLEQILAYAYLKEGVSAPPPRGAMP